VPDVEPNVVPHTAKGKTPLLHNPISEGTHRKIDEKSKNKE